MTPRRAQNMTPRRAQRAPPHGRHGTLHALHCHPAKPHPALPVPKAPPREKGKKIIGLGINVGYGEELDVATVKEGGLRSAEVDDAPHVGGEPQRRVLVLLVLSDQDRVGHREESHHRRSLEKVNDDPLIVDLPLGTELLELWQEMLQQAQAGLHWELVRPPLDPLHRRLEPLAPRPIRGRREGGNGCCGVVYDLCELRKHLLAAQHLVCEVGVALVLVLDGVVENLEEEDKVPRHVVVAQQPVAVGKQLKQRGRARGGREGEGLDVGGDVGHGGEEAVVEGLQLGRALSDELVVNNVDQVGVVARELRQVFDRAADECCIEVDAKVALSGQQEHDEG
mmetsp:Transcript_8003/g.19637  ORF Transcript_8003/g.19637 Transcript_8003/m.19637 type:complete len:338 (-) Transcript_8003:1287-2300(-)